MIFLRTLFLALFLLLNSVSFAQPKITVNNFRIFPSAVTQTEPVVAVHPTNPLMMFASAVTINTQNGFTSEGVYVSTNGGLNWFGSDSCKGALITNHGGDPGVAIDMNGRLIITHIGSTFQGVYAHYSTNAGATWSKAKTITDQQPEDKGTTTIDATPSSLFYGRAYTAFVNYVSPYPVLVSHLSNGDTLWNAATAINGAPPSRCSGGSIKTGSDGSVYVCWSGVTNTSPPTEDFAGFAVSTNGGAAWNVTQNIFDMNGINGTLPAKGNIRVNGLPQIEVDKSGGARNNWLYIVTTEKNLSPAGSDPDIILHHSTDGGVHWSSGMRVNQDALSNGKIQYFPAMAIDANGGINIIFYDDRNTSTDSAEIMLARSTDGGNSWMESVISNHRFKPKPILGGSSTYQGDHIDAVTVGNKLYAYWMDDFSGLYQVWSAIIDLPVGVTEHHSGVPSVFALKQNYPNPFNPLTVIGYSLSVHSVVTLQVYDVFGRVVATLLDGRMMEAGEHTVTFDAGKLTGGIYVYRLSTPGFSTAKKMLLLK